MKSKKSIYILVPIALLVWGLIGFKVIKQTEQAPNEIVIPQIPDETLSSNSDKLNETYQLKLNYKDPFLGKITKSRPSARRSNQNHKRSKRITNPHEKKNWPDVEYGGRIRNQDSDKNIAILKINSQEQLVKELDELKGIIIKDIYKDSIRLTYNSDTRVFYKLN